MHFSTFFNSETNLFCECVDKIFRINIHDLWHSLLCLADIDQVNATRSGQKLPSKIREFAIDPRRNFLGYQFDAGVAQAHRFASYDRIRAEYLQRRLAEAAPFRAPQTTPPTDPSATPPTAPPPNWMCVFSTIGTLFWVYFMIHVHLGLRLVRVRWLRFVVSSVGKSSGEHMHLRCWKPRSWFVHIEKLYERRMKFIGFIASRAHDVQTSVAHPQVLPLSSTWCAVSCIQSLQSHHRPVIAILLLLSTLP